MSDTTSDTGPVLAADGTPLKASLNRALRREKLEGHICDIAVMVMTLQHGAQVDGLRERVAEPAAQV